MLAMTNRERKFSSRSHSLRNKYEYFSRPRRVERQNRESILHYFCNFVLENTHLTIIILRSPLQRLLERTILHRRAHESIYS